MTSRLQAEAGRPNFVKVSEYRDDPDPGLAKNPMVLTFPPPQPDHVVYEALYKDPVDRPQDFLDWPLEQRKEYLDFIDEFHYVFQNEIDLTHKTVSLIRKSYRTRDPQNPRIMNAILRIMSGQEVKTPRTSEAGAGGGLGLLITGITGLGKSSLLDRLVAYLGDYGRFHQTLNGEPAQWPQLGVIRVNVKDSWKEVLKAILAEIDRQLGRDYYLKRERSASSTRLESAVHEALTAGFAPLLIIDELQRLARLNEEVALKILQGLIDMMGIWGIPVVVVGTVRVRRLLEKFSAEMDKFSNGGTPEFLLMHEGDEDTANFILLLKEHSISRTPIEFSADFDKRLMSHCMGVRRIMREYMKVVLQRHANNENIKVDGNLLDDIAQVELKRFQKALSVLRKVKLGMALSFGDLQDYEDYLPEEPRTKTGAQVRLDAQWRREKQAPMSSEDSPDVSADEFTALSDWLEQEESSDRRRAKEDRVEKFDEGAAKKAEQSRRSSSGRAAQQSRRVSEKLKSITNVVPLGAMQSPRTPPVDGVDPGEVS